MSWFTDIAGKAEDFLNKIDQNTAVAITHVQEQSRSSSRPRSKKSTVLQSQVPPEDTTINSKNEAPKTSKLSSVSSQQNVSVGCDGYEANVPTPNPEKESVKTKNVTSKTLEQSKQPIKTFSPERRDENLLNYLNNSSSHGLDELTVLRNELETQSKEMSLLLKNYRHLQKDYDSLKRAHESAPQVFQHTVENPDESTREQLEYLENSVRTKDEMIRNLSTRLSLASDTTKHEDESKSMQNRLEQLELENDQLKVTLQNLEDTLGNIKENFEQTCNQLQSLKKDKSYVEQEFCSYKDKAKGILKSKDDEILSLTDNIQKLRSEDPSVVAGGPTTSSTIPLKSETLHLSELTSLRNERELLMAEISQFRSQMTSLKEEIGRLESEILSSRQRSTELQDTLTKERQRFRSFQEENLQMSQSMSSLQMELERIMIEKQKLEDKYENCRCGQMSRNGSSTDFQNHLNSSSSYSPLDTDEIDKLRTRIVALSQALLEKQSLINAISSDKQLLQINVERLEAQLAELRISSDHFNECRTSTSSVISTQPLYMSESPWDSNVTLQVKRAYSRVDSLCCQFGMVLRQRPRLRFGFSAYVLLLHIWVFFILFSWTHNSPTDLHK